MYTLTLYIYNLQICSSVFLTQDWLDGFFTIKFANKSDGRPIPDADFRKDGMLFFYIITGLCNFSKEAVAKSAAHFRIGQYVHTNALQRKFISIFESFSHTPTKLKASHICFLLENFGLNLLKLPPPPLHRS